MAPRAAFELGGLRIPAGRAATRVLAHPGMIDRTEAPEGIQLLKSRLSRWLRARWSGIALLSVALGQVVGRGQPAAVIHDSQGARSSRSRAPFDGIVGLTQRPRVHQGDALLHVAPVRPAAGDDLADRDADDRDEAA